MLKELLIDLLAEKKRFQNRSSKSKFKVILFVAVQFFLFLTVLSIPLFSFLPKLYILTWFCTGLLLVSMCTYLAFFVRIRIDVVFLSFYLFILLAIFSSALNRFSGFAFTPILMAVVTSIIYLFASNNKNLIKHCMFAIFLSIFSFAIIYIVLYFPDLITFDFGRLGGLFGDENDIALPFSIGVALVFASLKTSRNAFSIITHIIILLVLCYCGVSTGSKAFILCLVVILLAFIFISFGLKKWYFSVLAIGGMAVLVIITYQIPVFFSLYERIYLAFLQLLIGTNSSANSSYSTLYRLQMFYDGILMFLRKPLFGYGIHGFHVASSFGGGWSHNTFSELLSCYGLAGSIAYIFPLISVFLFKTKSFNKIEMLPCLFSILIYIACFFTVVVEGEKMFAFTIGFSFAFFCDTKTVFNLRLLNAKSC